MDFNDDGSDKDVCQAHSGLVADVNNLGRNIDQLRETIGKLTMKLEELMQRPTWRVAMIISALSSLCGIFLTFILYTHFK